MEYYIGFHMSTKDIGFLGALKFIDYLGGNCVQVFMRSQKNDYEDFVLSKDVLESKQFIVDNNFLFVGHSMVNLAKKFRNIIPNLDLLILDMKKLSFLGGLGVVVHVGDFDEGDIDSYENIKANVIYVLDNSPVSVKIIFENVAGNLREDGFKFYEFKEIYDLFSEKYKERMGFVIDTCHSHAGGYDLSSNEGVELWADEIERYIGWNKVFLVHLNDSFGTFNSKLDRHADLGFGSIGVVGLRKIVVLLKDMKIPIILETPKINSSIFEQIELVKSWI